MNASFGGLGVDSNGDLISNEAGNAGDEVNGITKYGGSFSTAALDGTTAATLGEGSITVRNETAEATRERLASVNRDLDNLTTPCRAFFVYI